MAIGIESPLDLIRRPLPLVATALLATMVGCFLLSSRRRRKRIKPMVDPDAQTVEISADGARVSASLANGQLRTTPFEGVTTVYDGVRRGERESAGGPMVGYRKLQLDGSKPYTWYTYKEILTKADHLAAGFLKVGLAPGQSTFVGIYSRNCPEWIVSENACYSQSMVVVPLYDTLGADACVFIINQTQIALVVCDNAAKATSLLEQRDSCPSLKHIVVIDGGVDQLAKQAADAGVSLISFDALVSTGKADSSGGYRARPPSPGDLATVCYTSGTTGTPKGVTLTHASVVADCTTLQYCQQTHVGPSDVMIGFLPLAHMMERVLENAMYMLGGSVGFFSGDVRTLTDDMKALQPTIVPVVPRLLNRIYDKVMSEASKSGVKKFILSVALKAKLSELKDGVVRHDSIWDRLVFGKVRDGMGGRVRLVLTGSAPVSAAVLQFTRAALGCVVLEGYGQTESTAAATISLEGDHEAGHVGVPVPCCAVKLVDVAEMNYRASEGRGEVCVRGANVFSGYYKDEEKTRETLDADGWLHTGDVGQWTPSGTLRIIDRKKHIFKLAQGEYVAPEKIEGVYLQSRFVAQVFVDGNSLKSCLVAVVVPDWEVLPRALASVLGTETMKKSFDELCKDKRVKEKILEDMKKTGAEGKLNSIEQVKAIHLTAEAFSIENGLLTPTLKSKRPQLREQFQADIDRMYERLP